MRKFFHRIRLRYYAWRTLRWVNEQRKKWALPALPALPTGVRYRCAVCPIARALESCLGGGGFAMVSPVDVTLCAPPPRRRSVYLIFPSFVTQFIAAFDHGEYPNLIR